MPNPTQYCFAAQLQQICSISKVSSEQVLRRAGLPEDFLQHKDATISADTYFDLWRSFEQEATSPDVILNLGLRYARGPFASPVFAFSSADTVESGLRQLSKFKPLIGPVTLSVESSEDTLVLTFEPTGSELIGENEQLPASMSLFELIYVTECTRTYTGENVTPLLASCPPSPYVTDAVNKFLGTSVSESDKTKLVLSAKDAQLPLITSNDCLWHILEPIFNKHLVDSQETSAISASVRSVLIDMLAGGSLSAERVAQKLHLSKRSLQRRLNEEGTTFQQVLAKTRLELSRHYLQQQELSLVEISHLLGFKDQSSSFRAYHRWTGETPNVSRIRMRDPKSEQGE